MTAPVRYIMHGQMPTAPYQDVTWSVYNTPDTTGEFSGYGAGYLINIYVDYTETDGIIAGGNQQAAQIPPPPPTEDIIPLVTYVMKALCSSTFPPNQMVTWKSEGSPDFTGALSGFPQTNLSDIIVDYTINDSVTSGPQPSQVINILVGPAFGDLTGSYPSPLVVGIDGKPINTTGLAAGYILAFNGTEWIVQPAGSGTFSAGGDLAGTDINQTVIGLRTKSLATALATLGVAEDGYALTWNNSANEWQASIPVSQFTPGGDLAGNSSSQIVVGIRTKDLSASLSSIGASQDGYVLTWNNSDNEWQALSPSGGTLNGDVIGPASSNTVIKINGAGVPIAGALTIGNVLQVFGTNDLFYGPINIGGGSNYITGILPRTNQQDQLLGTDLSGTTGNATVIALQHISVANTAPSDGYVLMYSLANNRWQPGASPLPTGAVGGDLDGNLPNPWVRRLSGPGGSGNNPVEVITNKFNVGGTSVSNHSLEIATVGSLAGILNSFNLSHDGYTYFGAIDAGAYGLFFDTRSAFPGKDFYIFTPTLQISNGTSIVGTIGGGGTEFTSDHVYLTTTGGHIDDNDFILTSGAGVIKIDNNNFKWTKDTTNPFLGQEVKPQKGTGGGSGDPGYHLNIASQSGQRAENGSGNGGDGGNLTLSSGTGGLPGVGGANGIDGYVKFQTGATDRIHILPTGSVRILNLAGSGSGIVSVDNLGTLGFVGGAPPSGAAGGDLGGTYPNPEVDKIRTKSLNLSLASIGVGQDGYSLIWDNSSSSWIARLATPGSSVIWAGDLLGSSDTTQQVISLTGSGGFIPIASTGANIVWNASASSPKLTQADTVGLAQDMIIQAQSSEVNGGNLIIFGGQGNISGTPYIPARLLLEGGPSSSGYGGFTLYGGGGVGVASTGLGILTFGAYGAGLLHSSSGGVISSSAVDLASGDVTGILPTGNQASQSMGGDVSGTTASATVVALLNKTLNSNIGTAGAGQDQYVITWNNADSTYKLIAASGGTLAGDVTGSAGANTVVKIRNTSLDTSVGTVGAAQDGYALTWENSSSSWKPKLGSGGSGVTTVGTIDTSPNSNGLFISGSTISTQLAGASAIGMVSTTTQTFAGAKTFSGIFTTQTTTNLGSSTTKNTYSGGQIVETFTCNSSLTLGDGYYQINVVTSAARSITLPAPANGREFYITDVIGTANTNNITLVRNGSEKINGVAASKILQTNWGSWRVYSNGTDWFVQ